MAKNDDLMQRKPRCSFCGKTQDQVRRLIAGPNAYICDECITLCQEIMSDDLVMPVPGEPPQGLPSFERSRPGRSRLRECGSREWCLTAASAQLSPSLRT